MVNKISVILIILVSVIVVGAVYLNQTTDKLKSLTKQLDDLKQYKARHDGIMHIADILSAYPLQGIEPYVYAAAFDTIGRKYDIHWEAVVATIDIETGRTWNPTQTSSASCKGIMQMKESTAQQEANKQGISYQRDTTVWCEIRSLDLGASYLSRGLKEHGYGEGFKYYVGGSGFGSVERAALKRGKRSRKDFARIVKTAKYIRYYDNIVSREYRKLCMMSGRADD